MQTYLTAAKRKTSTSSGIDWLTISLYLLLMFLGWINIYAAVYNEEYSSIFDFSQRYGKQLIWIGAAVLLGCLVFLVDSKFYSVFAFIIYIGIILLLLGVLLFGVEVKGARSWFQIGGFSIQPAEFAKVATALALAKLLSTYNFKIHKLKNLIKIAVVMFTPAALILLQNDTGSALVYVAFILVLFREGLSGIVLFIGVVLIALFVMTLLTGPTTVYYTVIIACAAIYALLTRNFKQIGLLLGAIAFASAGIYSLRFFTEIEIKLIYIVFGCIGLSLPIIFYKIYRFKLMLALWFSLFFLGSIAVTYSVDYVFNNVLVKHQQSRIKDLLGIESDPLGAGYNVAQSKIAIGSGGFSGKGFLQGTQTKFDFVPEQSTDFIFCTVGEEWGFLGTSVIIILFMVFLFRIITIAERQKSVFTRVYAYGVASILFFHFTINIGMTIGLLPVIGIPLPFFSYGGSSLWGFTILLAILIKLDAARTEIL